MEKHGRTKPRKKTHGNLTNSQKPSSHPKDDTRTSVSPGWCVPCSSQPLSGLQQLQVSDTRVELNPSCSGHLVFAEWFPADWRKCSLLVSSWVICGETRLANGIRAIQWNPEIVSRRSGGPSFYQSEGRDMPCLSTPYTQNGHPHRT